ncbi:MAG: bifunctional glutamine-synthetase adenylyltransferase/deadenyltransferase, partial [Nocardioides sp.]
MTRDLPTQGQLVRAGFRRGEHALGQLTALGGPGLALLPILGRAADPDLALDGLVTLTERVDDGPGMLAELADDEGTAMRLIGVLGASTALADHLHRHPEHWRELTDPTLGSTRPVAQAVRASLLTAVGADPEDPTPHAGLPDRAAVDALRVEYRRILLRMASRDLAHHVGVDDIAAELSDLAAGTLDAALAIARVRVGAAAGSARLAVVAMGKCGGHELNYVSDVDVIFVYEPVDDAPDTVAARAATQLASQMMQICSDHTAEGTIWPVDAALRPEGTAGHL